MSRASNEQGAVVPIKLAHIVLRTKPEGLEALSQWYQTVLGAHVVFGDAMAHFLTYDDEHHRIAIIAIPGLGDRVINTEGMHHFAFTFSSLRDLLGTWERLKALGIEPATCIHHGPTISMYYLDPDRNQVELQIDVFDSIEESNRYIEAVFADNPIGVLFDPDDLAKRLREGVPEEELKKPLTGPIPPIGAFAEN